MMPRFHTYVGNRVQHIHDRSKPNQWHYIASDENPADKASRGLTPKELLENAQWFRGPNSLWERKPILSNPKPFTELQPGDIEVKKYKAAVFTNDVTTKKDSPTILELNHFNHSSLLHRLKRSMARIQIIIKKKKNGGKLDSQLSVEELRLAEVVILKSLQHYHFGNEIRILQDLRPDSDQPKDRNAARVRNQKIKLTSSLYRLDPFLDEEGLLRVGGRLRKATIPYRTKRPIIIPKISHITRLLIRHYHCSVQHHQGRGMIHNAIRQAEYWIINGRSAVFHFIAECITCRKLHGSTEV